MSFINCHYLLSGILAALWACAGSAQAASLLHHWTFDEGAGSTVADAVGSADMSIMGSNAGWTNGQDGAAFAFDGTNHALTDAKDTVTSPGSGVAIAGWFKTTPGTANRSWLFEVEREYGMRIRNGSLQLSFNGTVTGAPDWGGELDDGLWHHFVAQNTNDTTELYVDGVLVGRRSENLASLTGESKNTAIAARQSGAREFRGTFDDFRYYDGGLSLNEIRVLARVADQPPVAFEDSYTMAFNTTLNVAAPGVLANDTEPDGDLVSAVLESDVDVGALNLNTNGAFTYQPPIDFVGDVIFTYRAEDIHGASDPAEVTLTVLDPAASLTPEEIAQIETDLDITLAPQDILDLSAIVKPQTIEPWRSAANLRIETHRKADLTVEVVDNAGTPVTGAVVRAELARHAFKFGGVVTVMDLTDAEGNLSGAGTGTNDWERLTKALFNALGCNNAFKPKITGQHAYLPGFLDWAATHHLDVRGHLLMWPGNGDLDALDAPGSVAGEDYGNHLSLASTSDYASYNVLGSVDTYKASARTQADRDALEAVVDSEIQEWAGRWNVYEWDVVNETLGNTLLQDLLGYDQMAEWFHIAESNKVHPEGGLFINEFQIISAKFEAGSTQYEGRRDTYFERIDRVISDGGPVTGIGFQSRFKYGHIHPETVYQRIEEFATAYPDLDLVGTEFEIKDFYDTAGNLVLEYDEFTRAQMTEEILTTYFSHDQVSGMFAWDFMNPETDPEDPTTARALCYYNGTVKMNALAWYYLHRIRYHHDVTGLTGGSGEVVLRGFKGEQDLAVTYGGTNYSFTTTLLSNDTLQVVLGDVTVTPGPPTEITVEEWSFDDTSGTALRDATNTAGRASFSGASPSSLTDGLGSLVVTQNPAKTNPGFGAYIHAAPLTMGPRNTGVYELSFRLGSADLSSGDPNGAVVGFNFNDSVAGENLFFVRLNKTMNGLALSTFIDSTYNQLHLFNGLYALPTSIVVRAEVDLDAGVADIYLAEGEAGEVFKEQVPLSATATNWDRIGYVAVNNSTDWGPTDKVEVDYVRVRKREINSYALFQASFDWQGETLTAKGDDPDGDGLVNFLEYALGGNPVLPDAAQVLPGAVKEGISPEVQFTLGADSIDLVYHVQHSEDLTSWTSIPPTRVHGQAGAVVRVPFPLTPAKTIFNRVSMRTPAGPYIFQSN